MTREEAIKWVTFDLESWEHQCLSYHPTKEALKMAIEALKQIKAVEDIINVSNLTIQEDVLKYKMIVDVVKGKG